MSMNREGKQEVIDYLKQGFSSSAGSFLVDYKGLTVADVQGLRGELREQGGKMQVAKARLMRIAAQESGNLNELDKYFKEQVALVFAGDQPAAIAKILYETSKKNKNLKIVAGCVEARCLDEEGVKFIATLPSREVLLARLVGLLSAPTTQFARVLNNVLVKFVMTLKAIEEQKRQ